MAYTDEALSYGQLLGNILNPPDENPPMKATAVTQPAGQDQQPGGNVATAPSTPAVPSVPATVTRSGNDKGATPGQKTWADYVRGANDASMANLGASSQAANQLRSRPSAAQQNAPLEQERIAHSQPTPYRDPKTGQVVPGAEGYKPSIGTRIARGFAAARTGGLAGVIDPSAVGATPYGAPNSRYQTAEANRQAQVASLDQQMKQNIDEQKAEDERIGKVGSEERANATGYKDVAAQATAQQNAESDTELRHAQADKAEQDKVPTSYEGTRAAAAHARASGDTRLATEYDQAADKMAKDELKKFTYAARATGGGKGPNEDLRQPMIDQATADIQKLNDYQYDPEANNGAGGFYDPTQPKKVYTPQQFTDLKNKISTKLDADLAKKKLQPLRVRFTVQGTTPGVDAQGNLTPPGQKPAAPQQNPAVPAQASTSGDSQYIGEPTQQELAGNAVFRKGDQTIVYRNGAYRDTKTGKEVK